MLGRYAELKAQLPPGTILFYQVGTFFETFEEDAKKISQALSIRLTSREAAGYAGGRVPLAGVPNHALQEHLATLLRQGHSVAVAEQRQHPTKPKQFTREVTQILTPGTVIEDNVLSAGQANYLAAFVVRDGRAGVAVVEAPTGGVTGTGGAGEHAGGGGGGDLPGRLRGQGREGRRGRRRGLDRGVYRHGGAGRTAGRGARAVVAA